MSGGREGSIKVRPTSNIAATGSFKAHHIRTGGVLSLSCSSDRTHFLSGGGNGEILLWAIGNETLPALASDPVKLPDDVKAGIESLGDIVPLEQTAWWPKM